MGAFVKILGGYENKYWNITMAGEVIMHIHFPSRYFGGNTMIPQFGRGDYLEIDFIFNSFMCGRNTSSNCETETKTVPLDRFRRVKD